MLNVKHYAKSTTNFSLHFNIMKTNIKHDKKKHKKEKEKNPTK